MKSLMSYAEHTADGIVVHLEDGSCIRIDVDLKNHDTSAIKKMENVIKEKDRIIKVLRNHIDGMQNDNARLNNILDKFTNQIIEMSEKIKVLESHNKEMKLNLDNRENQEKSYSSKIDHQRKYIKNLEKKLNDYKEEISNLHIDINRTIDSRDNFILQNLDLKKKISELEKKLAEQEEECRELDSDEIKAALDEMNERVENVFSDANTLIDNASVIQDEVHYLREMLFGDEDDEDNLDLDDTEEYCPCCKVERLKKLADAVREKIEKGE